MFDKIFSQFLTAKSTDFMWVVFLILANDFSDRSPLLAGICIAGAVVTAIVTAYLKTKHSTDNTDRDAE